jgi:hypothetical protein
MADEKKEPWLNLLALTTVIFAVGATLSTFKGGGYSTRSVMSQSQASNQWAYFQAKSIKGNLYEMEQARLSRELKALEGEKGSAGRVEEARKALAEVEAKVAKYDKEKAEIQKEALALEARRDDAAKHGQPFGLAVIFLQIAILLSSIAALLKTKPIYFAGLAVGAVGMVYFANGFFLFF